MKKSYAYGIINPEQKLIILNESLNICRILICFVFHFSKKKRSLNLFCPVKRNLKQYFTVPKKIVKRNFKMFRNKLLIFFKCSNAQKTKNICHSPSSINIFSPDEPLPTFMLRCYLFVQQFMENQEPNTCL